MLTNNCVGCGTVAHLFCHAEHSLCVIPSIPFVSFRAHARNPVWMLCFAQHDKSDSVIPSESEESMTLFVLAKADASLRLRFVQNDKSRSVTPNACEESIVWMLRFAQHDKLGSWIPHFADASFSMTRVSADIGTIGSSQYECARGAVHRRGLEPPTARVEIWCSIQLSYRCRHEGVTKLSRTYNKSMICA